MRVVRHSIILRAAERGAGRVRDLFAKSRILQAVGDAYPRMETAFRRGRLSALSDAEWDRDAWQFRLRHAWMRTVESSLVGRLFSRFSAILLETSIGTYGCFGVLYGAFAAAIRLAGSDTFVGSVSLYAAFLLCVASVPLLLSNRSLSNGIRRSACLSSVLIDFCGVSETRLGGRDRGREHLWWALFLAFGAGLGSIYLSVARTWLLVLIFLTLWLLFLVPELAVTAFLFLFPFLEMSGHATLAAAGLVALCFVTWLVKALGGRRTIPFGVTDFSVLLFALTMLLGGLVSAGGSGSRNHGVAAFVLIAVWFPVRGLLSDRRWRKRAFDALKLGAFITSLWGIGQYFLTDLSPEWVDVSRFSDIGGRVCAGFGNPNVLAVYLLCTVPLFLSGVSDTTRRRSARLCDFLGFCVGIGCLVLTWSRGAWLGIMAATLLFLLSYSRRAAGSLTLCLLPVGCLLPLLPHSIVNRFTSIGSLAESSIRYRLYTWRGVLRMLRRHVWGIGVGSEAFDAVYPTYAVSGTERVMHTHQLWMQIMTETGIAGLLSFLWLFLLWFLSVAHGMRCLHGEARGEMLGCVSALTGVLVMGFFDYVWYHLGMMALFFAIAAMMTLPITESEVERI